MAAIASAADLGLWILEDDFGRTPAGSQFDEPTVKILVVPNKDREFVNGRFRETMRAAAGRTRRGKALEGGLCAAKLWRGGFCLCRVTWLR